MKIFEEMKAALEAQAPIGDETEKVKPTPISTVTQNISIHQVPEHTQPLLFQIGDKVSYRTPVIKTPTDYSWSWHHRVYGGGCKSNWIGRSLGGGRIRSRHNLMHMGFPSIASSIHRRTRLSA